MTTTESATTEGGEYCNTAATRLLLSGVWCDAATSRPLPLLFFVCVFVCVEVKGASHWAEAFAVALSALCTIKQMV